MIRKLFLDHPATVDETYGEHARFAAGFGWSLLVAGLACFVHALIPALCVRTGSNTVLALHERLLRSRAKVVENHRQEAAANGQALAR